VLGCLLRGSSIGDVLDMTVAQARDFFRGDRAVNPVLNGLIDVGLDYLRLGQPLPSLSGGECQRIKLASHLHRSGAVYVLDEPTTGLHMSDVDRLIGVLDGLVESRGASVIVIEHNLEVIAQADWIIDLGPEGGSAGGQILFSGTPSDLVTGSTSYTAEALSRSVLG
jgi:excinuclease UvrABC ATPase subunit